MSARRGVMQAVVIVLLAMLGGALPVTASSGRVVTVAATCGQTLEGNAGMAIDGVLLTRWACLGGNGSTLGAVVVDLGGSFDVSSVKMYTSKVGAETYCGWYSVDVSADGVSWYPRASQVNVNCDGWTALGDVYERVAFVKVTRSGQSGVTLNEVIVSPVMSASPAGGSAYLPYGLDSWRTVAVGLGEWFSFPIVGGALVAMVGLSLAPEIFRALALMVRFRSPESELNVVDEGLLGRAREKVRKQRRAKREKDLLERYGAGRDEWE